MEAETAAGVVVEQEAVDPTVPELVRQGREARISFDVPGYEEAVPLLREAIELAPSRAPAYAELSLTYSNWGFRRESACAGLLREKRLPEYQSLYDMAFAYAEMAVRLDQRSGRAHLAMAAALRRGAKADPDRREREAQLAAALAPDDPEVVCECWRVRGYDPDDADLRRALEARPDLVAARADLAQALGERGRPDEAFRVLAAALKDHPGNLQLYYEMALLLDRRGLRSKAREVLEKARALRPGDPLVTQGFASIGERHETA